MTLEEAVTYLKAIRMFGATLGFSEQDIINLALLKKEEENLYLERASRPRVNNTELTVTELERKLIETVIDYRRSNDDSHLAWIAYRTGKLSEEEFEKIENYSCDLYDSIGFIAEAIIQERVGNVPSEKEKKLIRNIY